MLAALVHQISHHRHITLALTMPSAQRKTSIIKFTNCRVLVDNRLVNDELWISPDTGKILNGQDVFYGQCTAPDRVIDLGGRIVSPGFIDVQLNGAFGFDFSVASEDFADYAKGLHLLNKKLVKTGVTSYAPTVTSQRSEVYHKVNDKAYLPCRQHATNKLSA
jgi:N-acetylglucosamine-6-phosphate deacetylase